MSVIGLLGWYWLGGVIVGTLFIGLASTDDQRGPMRVAAQGTWFMITLWPAGLVVFLWCGFHHWTKRNRKT